MVRRPKPGRAVVAVALTLALLPVAVSTGGAAAEPPTADSQHACPDWGMYGGTLARTFSIDCPSPITTTSVATLAPAWFHKTHRTVTASPAIAQGVVYVGDWSGTLYALDAGDGALLWEYEAPPAPGSTFGPIVSSAAVADGLVIFGAGPRIIALDTAGREAWSTYVGDPALDDDPAEVLSSPLVWEGRVYVGMDTHNLPDEETGGVRGGLLVLDAATGGIQQKFEPDDGHGCGGIWSSPTLDTERRLVFIATANCEAPPDAWTPSTEAVTALDADALDVVWTFQPHEPNRRDHDFGATPNLFTDPHGRDVLGVGNKDGTYYALDPGTGALLWATHVVEPGDVQDDFSIGGYIGSAAAWRGHVYGGTAIGGPPYYHALDSVDGRIAWQSEGAPTYAASAVVNGVVFRGSLDGLFRATEARTGRPLWSAPLAGPISSGPAVVGDSVYVGSGTSSSDACAKDTPVFSDACFAFFDDALGSTGGVHGFRLPAPETTDGPSALLFGGQGNQLDVYDLSQDPPTWEPFIPNAAGGGKDLNAQICQVGGDHILLGEDTDQSEGVPQGWGIFELSTRRQVGKLIADYAPTVQPEQYGCVVEDGLDRIFVSQVGAGDFANADGQLIVFFGSSPAFDAVAGRRSADEVCPDGDCAALTQDDSHWCVIDDDIRTAGGMATDAEGNLYVAEGSPTVPPDVPAPGRILRYRGPFPTSADECFEVEPETFISTPELATPVAIVPARDASGARTGHWYASSVLFPPVVNEYDGDGRFVRTVVPPGYGNPFGLAVDDRGTLYVADLGLDVDPRRIPDDPSRLGVDTAPGAGSVLRVRFVGGVPLPPEVIQDGLDFPDGLGIVR